MIRITFSVPLLGAILLTVPAFSQSTWYVDAAQTGGGNDGSSWADAFQGTLGLQSAMASAQSGDRIFVTAGTYLPTTTSDRSIAFENPGTSIYGGFLGGEAHPDQRPLAGQNPTILSGDITNDDPQNVYNNNSYNVMRLEDLVPGAPIRFDRITIRGGYHTGIPSNSDGAGIWLRPRRDIGFYDCRFEENWAADNGGAIFCQPPTGADTLLVLQNCRFTDNTCFWKLGGAVRSDNRTLVERCLFSGNLGGGGGGALFLGRTSTVANSLFHSNRVDRPGVSGGQTGTISASTVNPGEVVHVRGCTIANNESLQLGIGGIRGDVEVANSIVWGNADASGAMDISVQLSNSLIATYCVVQGTFPGVGNLDVDPEFVDPANADFKLASDSPAIDAGSNVEVGVGSLDLDGGIRFADVALVVDSGVGPAPIVDMGAFEVSEVVGTAHCDPVPNSSGQGGRAWAIGSSVVADDDFVLVARELPANQMGIFVVGTAFGFAPMPGGSQGNLCIGGLLGRFNQPSHILNTGASGMVELPVDLLQIPQLSQPVAVQPGDTFYFQMWYRDGGSSNFTNSVAVTFQ